MSRFRLVMRFWWKDTAPRYDTCSVCAGKGVVPDIGPDDFFPGGNTKQCWGCQGAGRIHVEEYPPLPEDIVEEMNRHLAYVATHQEEFKKNYDLRQLASASLDSSSL